MITLVEGMIGAGKTYYVVQDVLNKYYRFCENDLQWRPKEDLDFALYSNVDGFLVAHDLIEAIKQAGSIDVFFTVEYQRAFAREKKHIYVIDEAQKPEFFHRKYYNANVFYFFQYHRHLGLDIYLITQDVSSLAKELQSLNEYHIRAVRRSYSFKNEFRYNFMVGREIFRRRMLKKDLRVFRAYRSSNELGGQKVKSFAGKFYLYIIGFMIMSVFAFVYFIKVRLTSGPDKPKVAVSREVERRYRVIAVSSGSVFLKGDNTRMMKVSAAEVSGEIRPGAFVSLNSYK